MNRYKSFREESKRGWGRVLCEKQVLEDDELKLGCLMRIAEATELMAKNHQRLIDERDRYKQYYENCRNYNLKLKHRIAGLKGHINRLKRMAGKK